MSVFVPIHYPGVEPSNRLTFSPAVRCGRTVWISGLTATDDNLKLVNEGDLAEQTRYILGKMQRLLQSVGGSLADIVETTEYVTTFEGYDKTAAVRREMLKGPPWPPQKESRARSASPCTSVRCTACSPRCRSST